MIAGLLERGEQRLVTVRDVAGYLNVDEKTVYRLAKRGRFLAFGNPHGSRFHFLRVGNTDLQC